MPAAAPSVNASAIPVWKNRSGWAAAQMCMSVYLARSADRPTTRVSSLIFESRLGSVPQLRRIGLPDEFLLACALPTLHDRYGLSMDAVVTAVKKWVA